MNNDEGLYRRAMAHGGAWRYVRAHRQEIDAVIDAVVSGRKPAHYLVYGSKGG